MQIRSWQENNQSSEIWHNSIVFSISRSGGVTAGFKPMTQRQAHTQA